MPILLHALLVLTAAAGAAADAPPPPSVMDATAAFRAQSAALAESAGHAQSMTVSGRGGWLFLASELRFLGAGPFWGDAAPAASRAAKPDQADPLPVIADFQEQLAALGVELLLVPVPPKAVIYPEALPEPGEAGTPFDPAHPPTATQVDRRDAALQTFYGHLRLKGIRVLDLTPAFLKARAATGDPLYCRQDSHWSGTGCALAAREIAMELFATFHGAPKQAFTGAWEIAAISGDLWRALPEPRPARETLRLRRVSRTDSPGDPVATDPASPVIVLGDSHALVFHGGDDMHARGAGLPDQLAIELGFPVDVVAVRGSGATPARINLLRRAQRNPQFWAGRKWVVWCFAAREFTESDGWRQVPVRPAAPDAPPSPMPAPDAAALQTPPPPPAMQPPPLPPPLPPASR